MEIKLFVGGYPTERVHIAFTEKKDIRLICKGTELLEGPVTFEYKEDEKIMGKVTIRFNIKSVGDFTQLVDVEVVGGYKHRMYHEELTGVVNKFLRHDIEVDQYDYEEAIKNKKSSVYCGSRARWNKDKVLMLEPHLATVLYDVKFDAEINFYRAHMDNLHMYNGVVFKRSEESLRTVAFQMESEPNNPCMLIVNDGFVYESIAQLNESKEQKNKENKDTRSLEDVKVGDIVKVSVEEGHVVTDYDLRVDSVETNDDGIPGEVDVVAFGTGVTEEDQELAEEFTSRIDSETFYAIVE